jgi:uncharacterized membrane protein YkvA (DUF1232 family)
MADKKSSDIIVSPHSGMIHNVITRAKLIWRLLLDPRVSVWSKLIPIGAFIYVVSPWDLIMLIPGVDAIDDVAVVGLAYYFFIEVCPPNVVQEHLKAIENDGQPASTNEDVVDAETTEVDDKSQ